MDKQLDINTTFIQVRLNVDQCGKMLSEFVREHFGTDEFSTISGYQGIKITLGFGFKVDGHLREVAHILYTVGCKICIVAIKNFARRRFIDYMNKADVVIRVLPKMMD